MPQRPSGSRVVYLLIRGTRALLAALLLTVPAALGAEDCNGNGLDDVEIDIASGTSADCNGNDVPDECNVEPRHFGFHERGHFESGQTRNLDAADLDGDGDIDIVVANDGLDNRIVVLEQTAPRKYELIFERSLPGQSRDLTLADIDGDGRLDALCAIRDGLALLRGAAALSFASATVTPIGASPTHVVTFDVDGDGDLDVVTANAASSVSVLLNENGVLAVPRNSFSIGSPSAVLVRDVDEDGLDDVVLPSLSEGGLGVLRNAGGGVFTLLPAADLPYSPLAIAGLPPPSSPLDIVLGSREGEIHFVTLAADGSVHETASEHLDAPTSLPYVLFVADADLDGSADVIAVERGWISVGLGNESGEFAPQPAVRLERSRRDVVLVEDPASGSSVVLVGSQSGVTLLEPAHFALSKDCDDNGVPDECDADCDEDGTPDVCEILAGTAIDSNANGVPDECEPDCNANDRPDSTDLTEGESEDCNGNDIPDECELLEDDCDSSGVLDTCELAADPSLDCDGNDRLDSCDTTIEFSVDRRVAIPGPDPVAVDAQDLDADGSPDLVVRTSQGLRVVWGERARGSWRVRRIDALTSDSGPFAIADIDGDGRDDLCVTRIGHRSETADLPASAYSLTVLLQEDSRRFRVASRVDLGGLRMAGLAAGRIDGDGLADVVIGADRVLLLRSLGSGDLARAETLVRRRGDVVLMDIDLDGGVDLVVSPSSGLGHVVYNDGGSFSRSATFPDSGSGLAIADFDGDGDLDFVSGTGLFSRQVEGRFEADGQLATGVSGVVGGDMDGDGDVDLGLFLSGYLHFIETGGPWGRRIVRRIRVGEARKTSEIDVADFDGDGRGDYAIAGDRLRVLMTTEPYPSFGRRDHARPDSVRASVVCAADGDGDGDADLVVVSGRPGSSSPLPGVLEVLRNNGGRFSPVWGGRTLDTAADALEAADFDGDGDDDLIMLPELTGGPPRSLRYLRCLGSLMWEAPVPIDLPGEPLAMRLVELSGQEPPELVVSLSTGALVTLAFDGDAKFARIASVLGAQDATVLMPGDFDGDGTTDVLASNGALFRTRGDEFAPPLSLELPARISDGSAGDFDSDGRLDVAIATGSRNFILWNRPDGAGGVAFESQELQSDQGSSRAVEAADLDGDGDADLAWTVVLSRQDDSTVWSAQVAVFLNDERREFRSPAERLQVQGGNPQSLLRDLDGDGLADIVADSVSEISIFLNTSARRRADANADGVPDICASPRFRRGDADASGSVDITDAVFVLRFLFASGREPSCAEAADVDASGGVAIDDATALLAFLFQRGRAPAAPFPGCGPPPGELVVGCRAHPPCE